MIELAQLFQDVDAAIVQQESAIVDIEQKAEGTHENIGQANTQLDGAIAKARSRNRKKWICLFLFRKSQLGISCYMGSLLTPVVSASHHHHRCRCYYCGEGGNPRPKTSMIHNLNTDLFADSMITAFVPLHPHLSLLIFPRTRLHSFAASVWEI